MHSLWWRQSSLVCSIISVTGNIDDNASLFDIYKWNKVLCPSFMTMRTVRVKREYGMEPKNGLDASVEKLDFIL